MTTTVKIVSNVANTTIKAQTSLCQPTATLLIMRPGQPFFLATIMPIIHRIALQVATTPQATMTHQVVAHGAVIRGVAVVLMAVALAEVGKQKKTCTNVRAFFNSLALKKVVKYRQIISKRQMILFSHVRHQLHSHICKKQVMTEVIS